MNLIGKFSIYITIAILIGSSLFCVYFIYKFPSIPQLWIALPLFIAGAFLMFQINKKTPPEGK